MTHRPRLWPHAPRFTFAGRIGLCLEQRVSAASLTHGSRALIPPPRGVPGKKLTMSKPNFVDDYALIAAALTMYTDGVAQASSAVMRPAFNEEATMFSVEKGELSGGPIEGLFKTIDTVFEASPQARVAIAHIDIVGGAASARVDINDASGSCFSDFFHLLKVHGQWTIVGKIFHSHV